MGIRPTLMRSYNTNLQSFEFEVNENMTRHPVLEISQIHKSFGRQIALDGISLQVFRNEWIALLGPSGCGKTTLLRLIAGFEHPDQGSISIDGTDVRKTRPKLRGISMVFQDFTIFEHLTVRENFEFVLRSHRVARSTWGKRITALASITQTTDLLERAGHELSGGEQQRVAITQALLNDNKLLLLDEPLSNLDFLLRRELRDVLIRIRDELQTTAVIVTHDQAEAMAIGNRIGIMQNGALEDVGLPTDLYDDPQSFFVAQFLGHSPINQVPGRYDADINAIDTALGTLKLTSPLKVADKATVLVAFRPEQVKLQVNLQGETSLDSWSFEAEVKSSSTVGGFREVQLVRDGLRLRLLTMAETSTADAAGSFIVPRERILLFDAITEVRIG